MANPKGLSNSGKGTLSTNEPDETTPLKGDGAKGGAPVLLQEPVTWMRTLVQTYSWKLLAMVACTNHLLKGFVAGGGDSGLIGAPMEFLFKLHGVNGGQMQVYMAMATSPWALKPLIGLLSDSCPVFGYRKLPPIFATSVLGMAAVAVLGTMGAQLSLGMVVLCLFLAFLMVATADLLVEAKQSEEIKDTAELGPDFFLFTWLGIVIAMIMVTLLVGPIIQHWSPYACYLVAIPFMLPFFWPTMMNYMGEKKLPPEETVAVRFMANFHNHPAMFWLCLAMGVLIAGMSVVTFTSGEGSERAQALAITIAATILLTAIAVTIRLEVALPLTFWFLLQACPQVNGALFYFYTDDIEAFPDGPHFSTWMYATGLSVAGLLGVLTGYLTGSAIFKNWRYTSILLLTVPCRAFVRMGLVPVLWRWNRTRYHLGSVHDAYADVYWIFPIEFLASMLFAWSWVPKQVMNAHLTPTGNEATMLALTAGTFNLGSVMASYIGCWLLSTFKVCPDGTSDADAMENLWKPYMIGVVTPLLVLVLLPFFIPHKLQTEVLITEHPESCTYGSLRQRLADRNRETEAAVP